MKSLIFQISVWLIVATKAEDNSLKYDSFIPLIETDVAHKIFHSKHNKAFARQSNEATLAQSFKSFQRLGSVDINDARKTMQRDTNARHTVSSSCWQEFDIWVNDTENGLLYAIKMWDAWGARENGFLVGNVRWPGYYYECMDAKGPKIQGKWFNLYFGFQLEPVPPSIPININMGVCFPSNCSEADVTRLFRFLYLKEFSPLPPLLLAATPTTLSWMSIDTVFISVFGILSILYLIGTVVDLVLRCKNKNADSRHDTSNEAEAISQKHNITEQILLCFSVISNGEKILDMEAKPGALPNLDGIRVISTAWVVLGHTMQALVPVIDNTVTFRERVLNDASTMPIINGTFSVDTFFLLSGLLVAYLGIKHLNKTKGRMNILLMYLQRYMRLTPTYAFLLLFSMSVYKFMGSGWSWPDYAMSNYHLCIDDWWANLLYITNLYPMTNDCFPVAWYLSVDWQFYLLSPIFILLLYKFPRIGISILCALIGGGVISNGVQSSTYEIQPAMVPTVTALSFYYRYYIWGVKNGNYTYDYGDKYAADLYFTPWSRLNVYLIGMLLGYTLFVTKGKIKMNWIVATLGWLASAACASAVVYGLYAYVPDMLYVDIGWSAFYNAFSRPVWAACVAWVILACTTGYGGPVTAFLNWKIFVPLSRLTYTAYMTHIMILYGYVYSQEIPPHFQMINFVYTYIGTLVITFLSAFVVSLLVEWPFIGLMRLLFPSSPKPKVKQEFELSEVSDQSDEKEIKDVHLSVSEDNKISYNNYAYGEKF